jgi:hypothetical protein
MDLVVTCFLLGVSVITLPSVHSLLLVAFEIQGVRQVCVQG